MEVCFKCADGEETWSFDIDREADLSLSQIMDMFKLLTSTYPRYIDAESREAVEEVGMAMVRRDELRGTPEGESSESKFGVTEQVLGWMSQEVGRIQKRSRLVSVIIRPFMKHSSALGEQSQVTVPPLDPQVADTSHAALMPRQTCLSC